jgi:hypothetical protein
VLFFGNLHGQTTSTGALIGVALDPSGAVLPGLVVRLVNQVTGATAFVTTDEKGRFGFPLLQPGDYGIQASTPGSRALISSANIKINVTETLHLELHLRLATVIQNIKVSAESSMVQTDSSALGQVVYETAVGNLPLVTRNFAQITGLSPTTEFMSTGHAPMTTTFNWTESA